MKSILLMGAAPIIALACAAGPASAAPVLSPANSSAIETDRNNLSDSNLSLLQAVPLSIDNPEAPVAAGASGNPVRTDDVVSGTLPGGESVMTVLSSGSRPAGPKPQPAATAKEVQVTDTIVPEPHSGLLLMAAVGLVARRRTRR